uniref:Uncharacterized protein n=1 Tax=Aegilops tauschii subsp. strangulata TaxID=200361 RepID=A0A453BLT9_AEGTS
MLCCAGFGGCLVWQEFSSITCVIVAIFKNFNIQVHKKTEVHYVKTTVDAESS